MHGSDWPRAAQAKRSKALPRRREAQPGGGEAKRWMGTGNEMPGNAWRGRSMAKRRAVRRRIDQESARAQVRTEGRRQCGATEGGARAWMSTDERRRGGAPESGGTAVEGTAVAMRGNVRRWLCGARRSGGSAGKSTVTAMDGPAMRGRRGAKHGDGFAWHGEGNDWRSAGMAMHSQAKGMHSSEEQRKGAGLICGAWAKHRSATQRQGIATRSATQRQWLATQRRGKGVALLGDGMA